MTTETLDKAYLEYSNLTTAKTAKELELEAKVEDYEGALMLIGHNGVRLDDGIVECIPEKVAQEVLEKHSTNTAQCNDNKCRYDLEEGK